MATVWSGALDLEAALAQARERLRTGDLVHEMEVDAEDRRRPGLVGDAALSQIFSTSVRGRGCRSMGPEA